MALGAAAASLLVPHAAHAQVPNAFAFSFGGVEGLIEGLREGPNPCSGSAGDLCKVSLTDPGGTIESTGSYRFERGGGFTVSGSSLVVDRLGWIGTNGSSRLCFAGPTRLGDPNCGIIIAGKGWASTLFQGSQELTFGVPEFRRVPDTVPGPAPFLGAAAAFVYSCNLRKRSKAS